MDGQYRRSGRLVVAAGVTSTLVGFALLSDGFGAFRTDLRPQTLSGATAQLHATLNGMPERSPAARRDPDARWRGYLAKVEQDLARHDVSAAIRAWHDAHTAALESRRWEGMLEVGEAALAIGRASGGRVASAATATDAYFVALSRARRDGSVDGALRVADGFDALSNRTAVSQSLRVADRVSAERGDARGRDRVRRWVSQVDEPIVSTTDP